MADRPVPHALPAHLRDDVNMTLGDRQMEGLDSNGRFIIRRMVADAYASGFQDGRFDQMVADRVDRTVEADVKAKIGQAMSDHNEQAGDRS